MRNYESSHLINDSLNEELKNNIDTKLANFFYRTGISFRLVESEDFKDFVKSLNPSYASVIPNAKVLLGSLLDKQYTKCSTSVNEVLNYETSLTLISDGRTNIRGDHIVNICIKAPEQKPFFLHLDKYIRNHSKFICSCRGNLTSY